MRLLKNKNFPKDSFSIWCQLRFNLKDLLMNTLNIWINVCLCFCLNKFKIKFCPLPQKLFNLVLAQHYSQAHSIKAIRIRTILGSLKQADIWGIHWNYWFRKFLENEAKYIQSIIPISTNHLSVIFLNHLVPKSIPLF